MTLKDIIIKAATDSDEGSDVAFELWHGDRPIEIKANEDADWKDRPVVLSVDDLSIRLTPDQANKIAALLSFELQEYGDKLEHDRQVKVAQDIGTHPLWEQKDE